MKAMTLTRVIRIGSVTCRESLSTCADRSGQSFERARVTERKRERERERERKRERHKERKREAELDVTGISTRRNASAAPETSSSELAWFGLFESSESLEPSRAPLPGPCLRRRLPLSLSLSLQPTTLLSSPSPSLSHPAGSVFGAPVRAGGGLLASLRSSQVMPPLRALARVAQFRLA